MTIRVGLIGFGLYFQSSSYRRTNSYASGYAGLIVPVAMLGGMVIGAWQGYKLGKNIFKQRYKAVEFEKAWRQVCAYSFPRKALFDFSKTKNKTPVESLEDIEILRFLENGYKVKMIKMSNKSLAFISLKVFSNSSNSALVLAPRVSLAGT